MKQKELMGGSMNMLNEFGHDPRPHDGEPVKGAKCKQVFNDRHVIVTFLLGRWHNLWVAGLSVTWERGKAQVNMSPENGTFESERLACVACYCWIRHHMKELPPYVKEELYKEELKEIQYTLF